VSIFAEMKAELKQELKYELARDFDTTAMTAELRGLRDDLKIFLQR
jgi:hypothetical protein